MIFSSPGSPCSQGPTVIRAMTPPRTDGRAVAQLPGQEEVTPSSHHPGRRKPGQVGAVMIRASPELVGRCGMLDEVPPERDRCARNVDVGGLQRNPPQG